MTHYEQTSRIESETVLLPYVIAIQVCREVQRHFQIWEWDYDPYVELLVRRAEAVYASRADWQRKLKYRSNYGRDVLYTFMRHWLSGEMKDARDPLFGRLPDSFSMGVPL